MKFKSLILAFLFLPATALAGLSDQVQQTYKNTREFRARFVQKTHIEILDRNMEEKGELIFAKPGRFVIHYLGPRERKYVSDGKKLWIRRPREKEVEVYDQINELISREALVFLGGLGEMDREFRVSEEGGDQLILIPKKKGALFKKILLKIDPETHLVRETTLFPKSGNVSHYVFSDIKTNEPVSDSVFR